MARGTMLSGDGEARRTRAPRPATSMPRLGGAPRRLVTRRRLQLALGVLWMLDGALQLQPFMFTRGFADQVIAPSADGQPGLVTTAVHWSAALVAGHPVATDVLFAGVQLALGVALLFRWSVRPAIAASVVWSLGVWFFGEGLGGLAGGTATLLTGAPGAVALYALIGWAAWPRARARGRVTTTSWPARGRARIGARRSSVDDEPPATWVPAAWATLWGLFALVRALPANDSAGALAGQLQANAATSPAWLAHAERVLGTTAAHGGPWLVVTVVAVELGIGLVALRGGLPRRVAALSGIGLALGVWVLGQAFGGIPTGMGTDPNSGPLVALLGVALLGCPGRGPTTVAAGAGGDRRHGVASRAVAA